MTSTITSTNLEIQSISSYTVPLSNSLSTSTLCNLPDGTIPLENQVAGHTFQDGTNSIGLLKDSYNGTVLKPAGKPKCGMREINFYKSLQSTKNPDLIELKKLVPTFKGTVQIEINNSKTQFIRLEDLTYGMSKPCIIDIKVGKRTWDPEATLDKIQAEEEKYSACKKTIGLCIPGFQVYSLKNQKLLRFSKEYGKSLTSKTFIDTVKLFLNYDYCLCKELLLEILKYLWNIKNWSIKQKTIKLYSSSILILYDAERLIKTTETNEIFLVPSNDKISENNYSNKNKILNGSIHNLVDTNTPTTIINILPSEVNNYNFLEKTQMITTNNYCLEDKSKSQNSNSANVNHDKEHHGKLNALSIYHNRNHHKNQEKHESSLLSSSSFYSTEQVSSIVRVKMIDFAHVFPTTDDSIDTNYLFGIENLVKILEDLLNETSSSNKEETNESEKK